MMLYPIIFTVVQPLAFGILDQDIEEETLMRQPYLYSKGRVGTVSLELNVCVVETTLSFSGLQVLEFLS